MKNFLDFVTHVDRLENGIVKQAQNAAIQAVANELKCSDAKPITALPASGATEFAVEIGNIAYSKDFLQVFSDAIGLPEAYETEEEFVARAKEQLTELLRRELDKGAR